MCALWAVLLVGCSGCAALPRSRDPGDMELITVMGVDVTETGHTRLTLLGGQKSFEGGDEQPEIITAEADEPAAAAEKALLRSEKLLFPGNAEYILIGRSAAERGIAPILDYLLRDNDIRPVVRLCLVEGDAEKLITDYDNKAGLADRLAGLFQIGREQTALFSFSLAQAAAAWYGGQPLVMPMLRLSDGKISPAGGAVLTEGKLLATMDSAQTRGYMLLTGAATGHPLELSDRVFRVRDAAVKMKPDVRDGALRGLSLSMEFEMSLTQSNMETDFSRSQAEEQACAREEDCIRSALMFAQEAGQDIFGFGEKLQARRPALWRQLDGDWPRIWARLPVTLETKAKFDRTFDLWEGK